MPDNTEAIARIKVAIPDFSGRKLCDTSEVVDVLLDLMQMLSEREESHV